MSTASPVKVPVTVLTEGATVAAFRTVVGFGFSECLSLALTFGFGVEAFAELFGVGVEAFANEIVERCNDSAP